MKKFKCLLSFLLTLTLLSSCFIMSVSAEDGKLSAKFNMEYGQTEARKILGMINEMRTGSDAWYWNEDNSAKVTCSGLSELVYDYTLEKIAMQRAAEIALSFSHTRPDGTICFSAFSEFGKGGYNYGENIAAGSSTAAGANTQWREDDEDYNGQGHRRNMLDSEFNSVGIGHVKFGGVHYWVEVFNLSSSLDVDETEALDSEKTVEVKIDSDNVTKVEVTPESDKVEAKLKKEVDSPKFSVSLTVSGTWPSRSCEVAECDAEIEIEDSEIAFVKDGKIYGEKLGDTKYKISAFGESVSLDLNVSCEHEYEVTDEKVPTCTEDGSKTHKCKICGDEYTETLEKLGHDMIHHERIDSDCQKKGQKEYWHCNRCEKNFFDALGENEAASEEDLEIPLGDHNYQLKSEDKATCTNSGEKFFECSVCGDTYSEYIAPLGHNMVYHGGVSPTCTAKGEREHWHCTNCSKDFDDENGDYIIDEDDITLDKIPHRVESFGQTVKATHFNAGSTAGTKCSVCGKIFTKSTTSPKKTFGKITLKSGKKKFVAKWKKISGNSGYQIKYSLKKSLSSAKTKNLKGKKITVNKLKSKKTYYVKVRAFKKVNGKKVYSDWSKLAKVKVKQFQD